MALPVRYKILGLLALGTAINYIDRINIAVAAPDIMLETGWDKAQLGIVMSAFFLGYALFHFPAGLIADRWTPRKVIALSCLGFSLFTALTPLGRFGLTTMIILRILLGLFESATLPALASFNARWIPRQEFGRAQMVCISGVWIGQMLAYPMTTMIIAAFSWPHVFYFNAVLGLLWLVGWLLYATDTPAEHRSVGPTELSYIEDHVKPRSRAKPPSVGSILTTPGVVFLCLTYMFYSFIGSMFILWFPTYLVEARGLSRLAMGGVGTLPTLGAFIGTILGGAISDWLLRRGFSARVARAYFSSLCIGLCALSAYIAVRLPSATLSVILFVLFYFTFALAIAGYWAIPLEFGSRAVGAVSGIMSTCGSAASVFAPMLGGFVVTYTGSWTMLFNVVTAFALIAATIFLLLVVPRPIALPAEKDAVPGVSG